MHILNLLKRSLATLLAAAWLIAPSIRSSCQAVPPMPKDSHPVFEIATIKPTAPNDLNQGYHLRGHRVSIENQTVESMIMFAYSIHARQILAPPEWFHTERFDIDGVPDIEGEPSLTQYQGMVRSLLQDRFGLKFHREQRELPIYAITVAKSGSRLTPSKAAPGSQPDQTGDGNAREQYMKFTNNTMDQFALGMQYFLSRPVVNQTSLSGRYDFTLRWGVEDTPASDTTAAPGMFTAIQEQLGLKLDAVKGTAQVLVIDQAMRPSPN